MDINLELKNIQVRSTRSEDTYCYQAVLYCEGRRVADVANDGTGGPDRVHWYVPEAKEEIEAAFRRAPPVKVVISGITAEIPNSLELWCGERVSDHMTLRDYRKLSGRFVLVAQGDDIYQIKRPRSYDEDFKREIAQKYPDSLILNDLSEEHALMLFRGSEVVMSEVQFNYIEMSEEELLNQTIRAQITDYEGPPPGGETEEERQARLERNNERLALLNPQVRRQIDLVRELAKKKAEKPKDEHPGARLRNPPSLEEIEARQKEFPKIERKPTTPKNGTPIPGSHSDRLLKAGVKPIKPGSPRAKCAELVVRPEGASTAELVAASGQNAHAVGNQIFYLRKAHGYTIDLKNGRYYGKLTGSAGSSTEEAA
jgi:hypothetical protein